MDPAPRPRLSGLKAKNSSRRKTRKAPSAMAVSPNSCPEKAYRSHAARSRSTARPWASRPPTSASAQDQSRCREYGPITPRGARPNVSPHSSRKKETTMQLNVTGHHVEVTESMRGYVEKKLERIGRHYDQVLDVHCI